MPKRRQKKSAKQLFNFSAATKKRWTVPDLSDDLEEATVADPVAPQDTGNAAIASYPFDSQDDAFNEEFVCALEEEDALSFYMGEYDQNYYYDSGNDEDDEDNETFYIPHGMMFGRKHTKLFEIVNGEIQFVKYNGDEAGVMQVLGVPFNKNKSHLKSTVGISMFKIINEWSHNANRAAKCGIQKPKLTRTAGCRSVRDVILSTDGMSPDSVFPFFFCTVEDYWQLEKSKALFAEQFCQNSK